MSAPRTERELKIMTDRRAAAEIRELRSAINLREIELEKADFGLGNLRDGMRMLYADNARLRKELKAAEKERDRR